MQIQASIASAQKYTIPFKQAVRGGVGTIVAGVLSSTIFALLLKPSFKK